MRGKEAETPRASALEQSSQPHDLTVYGRPHKGKKLMGVLAIGGSPTVDYPASVVVRARMESVGPTHQTIQATGRVIGVSWFGTCSVGHVAFTLWTAKAFLARSMLLVTMVVMDPFPFQKTGE